jgi:hypothetical protein
MKKKVIASLIAAAVVALAIMPAAFAAPSNCPLKNALTGNSADLANLPTGSADIQSLLNGAASGDVQAAPDTSALQNLLNGTGNASTCPKTAALQSLLNGTDAGTAAAPASLQGLLSKLGLSSACQQQNGCTSGNCPTGDCQSGNCLTTGCSAGTCPTK